MSEQTEITTVEEPIQKDKKPEKSMIAFGNRGIVLESVKDLRDFAMVAMRSGMVPKGFDSPESVMIAIQCGAEIGLTPMRSLQSIAVINGRPTLWGDTMLAICRSSGFFDEESFTETIAQLPENGGDVAICTVRRKPGRPVTREFSMQDANRAGLLKKTGPWQTYTKRMLQMKARSWALRDAFTDILGGFMSAEEAQSIPTNNNNNKVFVSQIDELTEKMKNEDTDI